MATTIAATLPKVGAAAATEFGVDQLREFLISSLPDAALEVYLRSALDSIDDFLGGLTMHEHLQAAGDLLALSAEADSIISVIENENGGSPITLDSTDYQLSDSTLLLRRLATGTHPAWSARYRHCAWAGQVAVTYTRRVNADARIRVAVALVALDLNQHPGVAQQQIGTWSETYANRAMKPYDEERAELLRSLIRGDTDDFVF